MNTPSEPAGWSKESIARLIDPRGWRTFDHQTEGAERSLAKYPEAIAQARRQSEFYIAESLRVADAIMALAPPSSLDGAVDGEVEVGEDAADFLEKIASGWVVIESDGRFITIQDDDGPGETTLDTHSLFVSHDWRSLLWRVHDYFLQEAPDKYAGCGLCIDVSAALAAAPLPVGNQGVMAERCDGTDTEATTSPSSAGSVAGQGVGS